MDLCGPKIITISTSPTNLEPLLMWARSKTLYRQLKTPLQHFCPHRRIGSLIRSWTTRTFGSLWLNIGRSYHNPGAISLRDHQFLLRHPSPLRRPSSLRNLRNPASAAAVLRGRRNASSPTPLRSILLSDPPLKSKARFPWQHCAQPVRANLHNYHSFLHSIGGLHPRRHQAGAVHFRPTPSRPPAGAFTRSLRSPTHNRAQRFLR